MSAPRRPPPEPGARRPWGAWRDERSGPKPPPPAHGIKIKDAGTTWWGRRWIEALEKLSPEYASRLARGKTYARTGRAHDLVVKSGLVTARVTGSRPQPYAITIAIPPLDDVTWEKAIVELAGKARYAAQLLAREMPEDVDDLLRGIDVRLFPSKAGDLTTSCSCPDWANPCKHVAATHYVLGDAFDRDPFLLFELRGRTREQVLESIRRERRDTGTGTGTGIGIGIGKGATNEDAHAAHGIRLGAITDADYERWRAPMPALRLHFAAPASHGAVIAALGRPPSWREKASPADVLAPLVTAAGASARALAMKRRDDDDGGDANA